MANTFRAAKWRGKAKARLDLGITLPTPGGNVLPTIAAGARSAISSGKNFPPYDTGSESHSFFFDWRSSAIKVILGRKDGAQLYPPTGDAVGVNLNGTAWGLTRWQSGVENSTGVSNVAFTAPPANTPCALTLNTDHSLSCVRLDTGDTIFSRTKSQMEGTLGTALFGGTFVSMHGDVGGTFLSSNMTGLSAQGNAVPLSIVSFTLDNEFRPALTTTYTGAGITGYKLEPRTATGPVGPKVAATVTVTSPGALALTGPAGIFGADQFGAFVTIRVYELVNGVETGVYRDTQPYTMPAAAPRPLRIGVNLSGLTVRYLPFTSYQDHFAAGNWSTTAQNNAPDGWVDADGWPTDLALSGGSEKLERRFHQPAETCTMELSWTQTTATDAIWARFLHPAVMSGITPQAASGGRRRATFTVTPDLPNTEGLWIALNSFPAGDPPKNISCYVVGADKTKAFTPTRQAFDGAFQVQRFMDSTNVNGNAVYPGETKYGWDDRAKSIMAGSYDGMNKEFMCKIVNDMPGNDLWLNLPMYWKDDYYLNVVPLIDQYLDADRKIYLELGNECSNFLLAGGHTKEAILRQFVARTGETRLADGAGAVGQLYRELAYESKRVFAMMRPTIPNFSSRCVVVNACFGQTNEYTTKKNEGFVDFDFVTPNAIYVIPGATAGQSVAQIKASWLASMNQVIDQQQIPLRDLARADGKRFGNYEVGTDWRFANGAAEQLAFIQSDAYQECHFALWNRLRLEFGDVWIHYWDVSGGGVNYWGLKDYDTAPYQKGYDGIMAVKALVT